MSIRSENFGRLYDGTGVTKWTVSNSDMSFSVCDFGCLLISITVPDKFGAVSEVVAGYRDLENFQKNPEFYGALVGRYANRISNSVFTLNGLEYGLDSNNGRNTLHSGFNGYHKMMWKGEPIDTPAGRGLCFTRISPGGEQGFPGAVSLRVEYLLTIRNEVVVRYIAESDAPTPINLTNHVYFNLKNAEEQVSVEDHAARIFANEYLEADDELIPTGRIMQTSGTVFDFANERRRVGEYFGRPELAAMKDGYDVCYCFAPVSALQDYDISGLPVRAEILEPESGRILTCRTDRPAMQFYTGCNLKNKFGGFCLETQAYNNAVNIPNFPSTILCPGEVYRTTTVYGFRTA